VNRRIRQRRSCYRRPRGSGFVLSGALAILLVFGIASSAAAARGPWRIESTPAGAAQFSAVSCATSAVCEAVGWDNSPIVVGTVNGGSSWFAQQPPRPVGGWEPLLLGISCASATICEAVGQKAGLAFGTTNGGATWSTQVTPARLTWLKGVSCPTPLECIAVGEGLKGNGAIVTTADGGQTWVRRPIELDVGPLDAVSCASTSVCVAAGFSDPTSSSGGTVLRTVDGGARWKVQDPNGAPGLSSISCPSRLVCEAVGDTPGHPGQILSTGNGGASWRASPFLDSGSDLYSISCGTVRSCIAVGLTGSYPNFHSVSEATTNGGRNWTSLTTPRFVTELAEVVCHLTRCVAVGNEGNLGTNSSGVIVGRD
jgi:photosystem II stability/assembly factor-like uncharacterized protein